MPKLKNISPLGALDVPLLRRVVDAGEVFDTTEDQARVLLLQSDNYQPADKAAKTLAASLTAQQDGDGAASHDGDNEDAGTPASGEGEGEDQ
ncbi:hypothetical protein AU252_19765 [Pseudarthrobacter sulfonivorans]|uniref:Uncharacterized protein n=1 Tax=Pseudarthrobacter sulfonivorans TaxID=121292 RepID=A0A0U3P1Q9_9MICC|nr:hypothetical protein [Pseudarthrobacter sulfonivorans]ALV43119.1 hypothetical protein AU252_19765 [Pseudarthrobacter sulfonivorans]